MENIQLPYKNDSYGNPIFARVAWFTADQGPKPIALIYHGGGLIVGSSSMVPSVQIEYLAKKGFAVVIPNYRLAPQVTAKDAYSDCEEAYDFATTSLPSIMKSEHNLEIKKDRVVTMGHSSGGSLALHVAACKPVKAVTAFYPSLYQSDETTGAHKPTSAPPLGLFPNYKPSEEDWQAIKPSGRELSEAALALPGGPPPGPRNKWQMSILKNGQWMENVLPDNDFAAIDPMTRVNANWPPVMIVQGDADTAPGSSLALAERAVKEMKAVGVSKAELVTVPGEAHMFDLPPMVGTTDTGPKWKAVVEGLNFLSDNV